MNFADSSSGIDIHAYTRENAEEGRPVRKCYTTASCGLLGVTASLRKTMIRNVRTRDH
ncbi:hypothetical protein CONPUDRAFT_84400 [Coniophora puteana RWD-64-598 SS2]|uniref:Uncharacterized protein n=1 Tax=Coniophora puteana (strain RWD-64-598) TaxID=741705 RepID=A0A5M3MF51_CONPW|nr:uncharacterized protein CONPUDRAFT_84400 [Coniophora puteana RWD-64-598 SS2]EIW77235.1 hypothetical protein CONPUDRAFT_84400 [Coniophora puteana RWD-64-598 SS2]